MLLARFVVLCFLLALACAQPAEAIDEALVAAEASLSKPSASLVVFEYREDPNSATRSGYPKVFLSFLEIPSGAGKNALVIERKNGLQMLEVTSRR